MDMIGYTIPLGYGLEIGVGFGGGGGGSSDPDIAYAFTEDIKVWSILAAGKITVTDEEQAGYACVLDL